MMSTTYIHFVFTDMSGDKCWTAINNRNRKRCTGCASDGSDCHEDVIWMDGQAIGDTVCEFFSSMTVENDKMTVFLESGVQLKSEVSSFTSKCYICMCEEGTVLV